MTFDYLHFLWSYKLPFRPYLIYMYTVINSFSEFLLGLAFSCIRKSTPTDYILEIGGLAHQSAWRPQ
jgi:hypothetical protein